MTVHATSPHFKDNAREALADPQLQRALGHVKRGFIARRQAAVDKLPEFDALRDAAREIKNHTLAHLDLYLERYEDKVRS
ncbi:MAG TPA: (Fe-S)-binding protein, partial [Beijerinckiaceae bacterium]